MYTHVHSQPAALPFRELPYNYHSSNRPVVTSSKSEISELEIILFLFLFLVLLFVGGMGWGHLSLYLISRHYSSLKTTKPNQCRDRNNSIQPTTWHINILPISWRSDCEGSRIDLQMEIRFSITRTMSPCPELSRRRMFKTLQQEQSHLWLWPTSILSGPRLYWLLNILNES